MLASYAAEVGPVEIAGLARPLVQVGSHRGMPTHVAAGVMPQLEEAAVSAATRLARLG